jgi:hypothetical protein
MVRQKHTTTAENQIEGLPMALAGALFTDRSISSLSANQAAGTEAVLPGNADRIALKIVPPADCRLGITSGAATGTPLYGGVENTFDGLGCPTNALYIGGLTTGAAVLIWEA